MGTGEADFLRRRHGRAVLGGGQDRGGHRGEPGHRAHDRAGVRGGRGAGLCELPQGGGVPAGRRGAVADRGVPGPAGRPVVGGGVPAAGRGGGGAGGPGGGAGQQSRGGLGGGGGGLPGGGLGQGAGPEPEGAVLPDQGDAAAAGGGGRAG